MPNILFPTNTKLKNFADTHSFFLACLFTFIFRFAVINLFEDGLLKKLSFTTESLLEYEIHENYKNMDCAEEEKKFLDRLNEKVGMSGKLQEKLSKHGYDGDGYNELNGVWFDFWYKDLYGLALSRGYMEKESKIITVISIFAGSLTFGVFFSVFLSFIPVVGVFIAGIILLPVIVVFSVGYLLASILLPHLNNIYIIVSDIEIVKVFLVGFAVFSWFAWFIIFGQNMTKLARKLTPRGLEIVRQLNGYKMYLKGVDRGRLSFSFNRESDLSRNRTSFSWLGVFGLITDKHWDEWYLIANHPN